MELKTEAGQAFARRLRDGQPDPEQELVVTAARTDGSYYSPVHFPWRALVRPIPPTGVSDVERVLLAHTIDHTFVFVDEQTMALSVAVLPSHREVAAAWVLRSLAAQADRDAGRGAASALPLLAESEGPAGLALHLAVMYGLGAKENADRVATVDAILAFGSDLNWRTVGEQLGDAVAEGAVKLTRAVSPLRQAAEAGAVAIVRATGRLGSWTSCPPPPSTAP